MSRLQSHPLFPVALCATACVAYLAFVPFVPSDADWRRALLEIPDRLRGGPIRDALRHGWMGIVLGWLWCAVLLPPGAGRRAVLGLSAIPAMLAATLLLAWGEALFVPRLVAAGSVGALAPGLALGAALGLATGRRLSRVLPELPPPSWGVLALIAVAIWMLPWRADCALGEPACAIDLAASGEIAQRGYRLIKAAILWAPIGLIYGIAGSERTLASWGLAMLVAFAAVALPFLPDLRVGEVLGLLAAFPGLWIGEWLGSSSRRGLGLPPYRTAGGEQALQRSANKAAEVGDVLAAVSSPVATGVRLAKAGKSTRRRLGPIIGVVLIAVAAAGILDFPRWRWELAALGVAYLGVLRFWPQAWLLAVPAALPALDLATWTGRFFFDEFDFLMLLSAGGLLVWMPFAQRPQRPLGLLARLFGVSVVVSAAFGLFPVTLPPAPDAFASYWSEFNALRVAKGFAWAYLLYALLARMPDRCGAVRLFAIGVTTGLGIAAGVALWEHWVFVGPSTHDYRVTGTFSSMHVGGGHIEAYLTGAIAFAWAGMRRPLPLALYCGAVFIGTVLAVVTTVARGGIVALGVVFAVLAIGVWRARLAESALSSRRLGFATLLVGMVALAAGLASASYLQERFRSTRQDAQIRFEHWADGLGMIRGVQGWLLGQGLGSYPRLYFANHPDPKLGNYGFVREGRETFMKLNSGGDLYMAQIVAVQPHTRYRVEFDLRSDGSSRRIEFSVCEKKLFNSWRCEWREAPIEALGWQHRSVVIDSGPIGEGSIVTRRPVQLSFYNPAQGTVAEIDNVKLVGPDGENLIRNGDFSRAGDNWFFKSGDHLVWHVKNLWVHTLIEQGVVGCLLVSLLAGLAALRLARAMWKGDASATPWLCAVLAFVTLGGVDSIVDAPRLTALFLLAVLVGASQPSASPSPRSKLSGGAAATSSA